MQLMRHVKEIFAVNIQHGECEVRLPYSYLKGPCAQKNIQETATQKIQIGTYNGCDSLTSRHKIRLDELTNH